MANIFINISVSVGLILNTKRYIFWQYLIFQTNVSFFMCSSAEATSHIFGFSSTESKRLEPLDSSLLL
jgi:hypothetical protein